MDKDPSEWLDSNQQNFIYGFMREVEKIITPWVVEGLSPLNPEPDMIFALQLWNPDTDERSWMDMHHLWREAGLCDFEVAPTANRYTELLMEAVSIPIGKYPYDIPTWEEEIVIQAPPTNTAAGNLISAPNAVTPATNGGAFLTVTPPTLTDLGNGSFEFFDGQGSTTTISQPQPTIFYDEDLCQLTFFDGSGCMTTIDLSHLANKKEGES